MNELIQRFIRYAKIDTESVNDVERFPSSEKQKNLAKLLVEELHEMGVDNAFVDKNGYVYARIKGNCKTDKVLGLIAHMDTSPAVSGKDVKPRIVENYDGKDILLGDSGRVLAVDEYPYLIDYKGQDLIVTDGNTLLGADDKAGVAEIMQTVRYFTQNRNENFGDFCVAFTPDEEVGRGSDFFDLKAFGADVAYTVDGGALGEIEYENFNAAALTVTANGKNIHPGSAKGIMKNAIELLMEFHSLLPCAQKPQFTEKYEGFYHLDEIEGKVTSAKSSYIIRDHDLGKFENKKSFIRSCERFMNDKYGENTIQCCLNDSYYNMRDKILPNIFLIDTAKQAMLDCGVTPIIKAIRGGTDGARLSYMGLPCPNLCTGGENFHGYYEFACVQSMEKIHEILVSIVKQFSKM
ncbi:MAG: peptidase T [Clostridia bacterium]|nr:peptidase T [Clostridia bacterium]